ncbi:hypothetical protein HY837_04155, partial [archaeon]|nr:hypothetical protein [archaeon]
MDKQKLDQIIENAKPRSDEFKVRESVFLSDEMLREEIIYLVRKIFGEDLYYQSENRNLPPFVFHKFHKLPKQNLPWGGGELCLFKKGGGFFGEKKEYVQIRPSLGVSRIVGGNLLWSITINAYNPEALEQAKVFAQAYKDFAKQRELKTELNATIIQNFKTEQPSIEKLAVETTQKKKRHNPAISKEDKLEESLKNLAVKRDYNFELNEWRKKFESALKEYFCKPYRVKVARVSDFFVNV